MPNPIDLFFWPTPNGWKISIALEEMGLPYDVKLVNIGKGDQFDPEFLKIAPNNRMPAIVDPNGPDGAPISVFESGAILMYLARKTGRFYGKTERDRIAVEEWLKYAPQESLSLYQFQKPRVAKKLYFDVIPKAVDEYLTFLEKFPDEEPKRQVENPVWHIHGGMPPSETSPAASANATKDCFDSGKSLSVMCSAIS